MKVPGEPGWQSVPEHTGKYTAEIGTVYARCVRGFVCNVQRPGTTLGTELKRLADAAEPMNTEETEFRPGGRACPQFVLCPKVGCIDLIGDNHRSSPLTDDDPLPKPANGVAVTPVSGALTGGAAPRGSLKPTDMFHRAGVPDSKEAEECMRIEAEAKIADEEHEKEVKSADAYWSEQAKKKNWDCIKPDISVYRYSGKDVKEDPRRTQEYRDAVLKGLGFAPEQTRPDLTEEDMAACREVLSRNAGAFWIEEMDAPRTALRYLQHDTIPTGPPVRTPPHRLKGEEADWVDEQLQKEVITGQLIRGNSEWASPPFATKSFAEHRRQRKRRLVVDYRRVNARVLRAVYFVRSADGVVAEVAGSMWMSFVDACKGFNQLANTRRAREMLAILSRSGQYLPVCLTFRAYQRPGGFRFRY